MPDGFNLPVTLEQIAAVIRQMTPQQRAKLEALASAPDTGGDQATPAGPPLITAEHMIFSGVNGATGGYLLPPKTPNELFAWISGEEKREIEDDADNLAGLWQKVEKKKTRGVIAGIDPIKPEEAGWGIVYHPQTPKAVRDKLAPLVEYRKQQCKRDASGLPVEFEYDPIKDESAYGFRLRHGQAHGAVNPQKLPYYLLIVGPPTHIPFRFQYSLDSHHAVGRLHFDDVDDYGRYVASVLDYEGQDIAVPRQRRATFFGPDSDEAMALSAKYLIQPLAEALHEKDMEFVSGNQARYHAEHLVPQDSTRQGLLDLLARDSDQPALIFTATHGLGFPQKHPQQLSDQGALVCQGWPGSDNWPQNQPVPENLYVPARHLPARRFDGLMVFSFACYSAGTPAMSDFAHIKDHAPLELAPEPFVAHWPQRLLAQGALAFIGHVDRAWFYSYGWPGAGQQTDTFESTLNVILSGKPVGHAMEHFQYKYLDLNNHLTEDGLLDRFGIDQETNQEITRLWTARNDARSYILLGDPLVRLRPELMAKVN
jgi:hypothetical protein